MHSLRSRLFVLWLLTLAVCVALGIMLVQFYRQSTSAQMGRAEAVVARSCDMIRERYGFYVSGWTGGADAALLRGLPAVVIMALAHQAGVEGGIWESGTGALAYAFPTYSGSSPKTDVPQAEIAQIRTANQQAAREDQPTFIRTASRSETLLLYACPLGGPIPDLTGWAMTRVRATPGVDRLRVGLGALLALMVGMSAWLAWLVVSWSRHVGRMEAALAQQSGGSFPELSPTGEAELDRIIGALNEAGHRLTEARRRADELASRMTASERLAALGRVAAGVAHEIRNPIAAMRLRAENALAGDTARMRGALGAILTQIARLDALVSQLLNLTQRRDAAREEVDVGAFLATLADEYRDIAEARTVMIEVVAKNQMGRFDPELARRAIGNLVLNALQHTPPNGRISLSAVRDAACLRIVVADTGPGIAPQVRDSLFEPFVTGRPEGTGLGLAIAREFAEAQGGRVLLLCAGGEGHGASFALELPWELPWPPS